MAEKPPKCIKYISHDFLCLPKFLANFTFQKWLLQIWDYAQYITLHFYYLTIESRVIMALFETCLCCFCFLTTQVAAFPVSPPWSVTEVPNDHNRTCIEKFLSNLLGMCKIPFVDFLIAVFAPSPVLVLLVKCYKWNKTTIHTISIGFNSQWNLGRKMHS